MAACRSLRSSFRNVSSSLLRVNKLCFKRLDVLPCNPSSLFLNPDRAVDLPQKWLGSSVIKLFNV